MSVTELITIQAAIHGGYVVYASGDYGDSTAPLFAGSMDGALEFIRSYLESKSPSEVGEATVIGGSLPSDDHDDHMTYCADMIRVIRGNQTGPIKPKPMSKATS